MGITTGIQGVTTGIQGDTRGYKENGEEQASGMEANTNEMGSMSSSII